MQDKFGVRQQVEASYNVVCPPELHIPVPLHDLVETLRDSLGAEDQIHYNDLVKLVLSLSEYEFGDVRRQVKKNFKVFSSAARGQKLVAKDGRGMPDLAELKVREQQFLSDFVRMMETAHFHHLSQFEWMQALAEEYQFTMPVEVQWKELDTQLLNTFWAAHPELRHGLYEFADHVMVFHRGVGVSKASGMYVNEKIDLLVEYLVTTPLNHLLLKLQKPAKTAAAAPSNGTPKPNLADMKAFSSLNSGIGSSAATVQHGARHFEATVIERKTLRRLLPDTQSVLRSFVQTMELQEPTYKDVVILYRLAPPNLSKREKSQLTTSQMEARKLEKRNIHVKAFENVAMADMEMIFPKKRVHLKAVFKLQVTVTLVLALVGFCVTLASEQVTWTMLASALAVIGGRLAQVYTKQTAERAQMMQDMSLQLYNKTLDSQEGVVFCLLDEMAEQFTREVLLAYTLMLSQMPKTMTLDQVDELCEMWLKDNFDLSLDFSVQPTLAKCEEFGIVTKDDKGVYTPLSLQEGVRVLTERWATCFKAASAAEPPSESAFSENAAKLVAPVGQLSSGVVQAAGAGLAGITAATAGVGGGVKSAVSRGKGMLSWRNKRTQRDVR